MQGWRYALGALGVLGAIVWIALLSPHVGSGIPVPAVGGGSPPPPKPSSGRGTITTDPIVVFSGMTYFVALGTSGSVTAAANADRVKRRAEAEGFRDVVVSEGVKLSNWPGTVPGDYFVRGTFTGKAPKSYPRRAGVFLGSLTVLEIIEA